MANAETPRGRRALLLIDFQKDFLANDGTMPVARGQVTDVIAAAQADESRAAALRRLARRGVELRYVQPGAQ